MGVGLQANTVSLVGMIRSQWCLAALGLPVISSPSELAVWGLACSLLASGWEVDRPLAVQRSDVAHVQPAYLRGNTQSISGRLSKKATRIRACAPFKLPPKCGFLSRFLDNRPEIDCRHD